jgi:hypothetical protein
VKAVPPMEITQTVRKEIRKSKRKRSGRMTRINGESKIWWYIWGYEEKSTTNKHNY